MENEYRVLNTKVSPEVWTKVMRLCKAKGMTAYDMLQMMCDAIVRYMDDFHNLSPELEQLMGIFEHLIGWKDALNLADPTVDTEVCEAVYVRQDKAGQKHGFRASLVRKPFMGEWETTDNVVAIYERMTEVLLPEVYRKLRVLGMELGCSSIVDLMHLLIDSKEVERINNEFRKDFEDANRAANGKAVRYGERTKRKKHYDPDTLPLFPSESDDNLPDFKPFGAEW